MDSPHTQIERWVLEPYKASRVASAIALRGIGILNDTSVIATDSLAQHPKQRTKELIEVLQSITSMPGAHTSGSAHCSAHVNAYMHLIETCEDFIAIIQNFSPQSTFSEKEISTAMVAIAFHGKDLIGSYNKTNGIAALAWLVWLGAKNPRLFVYIQSWSVLLLHGNTNTGLALRTHGSSVDQAQRRQHVPGPLMKSASANL